MTKQHETKDLPTWGIINLSCDGLLNIYYTREEAEQVCRRDYIRAFVHQFTPESIAANESAIRETMTRQVA